MTATTATEAAGTKSAWHLYTIRVAGRDALQKHLGAQGISTAVHYPRPIHLQPAMALAGGREGDLPVSVGARERFGAELSLHTFRDGDVFEQRLSTLSF